MEQGLISSLQEEIRKEDDVVRIGLSSLEEDIKKESYSQTLASTERAKQTSLLAWRLLIRLR